MFPHRGRQ